tara:strand:+ start:1127 stop:1504 length:378 start_codon:yes stop_codon:yes gene_type:complete
MNIFGVGIDIVEIQRIKETYSRYGERFARKILSNSELRNFYKNKNKISFLAKRFAAKEAVGKALGVGIKNGSILKNIEIKNDLNGKPFVNINNIKKLNMTEKKEIHISLSDEKKYAVANALIISE